MSRLLPWLPAKVATGELNKAVRGELHDCGMEHAAAAARLWKSCRAAGAASSPGMVLVPMHVLQGVCWLICIGNRVHVIARLSQLSAVGDVVSPIRQETTIGSWPLLATPADSSIGTALQGCPYGSGCGSLREPSPGTSGGRLFSRVVKKISCSLRLRHGSTEYGITGVCPAGV